MARKSVAATGPIKTNIHSIFATDERFEEEGAWVEVNPLYGLKVKIRRMRSDAATKAYEKLVREELGEGKLRKPDDINGEQSIALLKKHLARHILVDWVNLRDTETGEDIPYSPEVSEELMEVKDFRDFVMQAANERDTFRSKADEEAEGN